MTFVRAIEPVARFSVPTDASPKRVGAVTRAKSAQDWGKDVDTPAAFSEAGGISPRPLKRLTSSLPLPLNTLFSSSSRCLASRA